MAAVTYKSVAKPSCFLHNFKMFPPILFFLIDTISDTICDSLLQERLQAYILEAGYDYIYKYIGTWL